MEGGHRCCSDESSRPAAAADGTARVRARANGIERMVASSELLEATVAPGTASGREAGLKKG
jgi:hypothetical protein